MLVKNVFKIQIPNSRLSMTVYERVNKSRMFRKSTREFLQNLNDDSLPILTAAAGGGAAATGTAGGIA